MSEAELRTVNLTRTGPRTLRAENVRGGSLVLGEGDTADFTPVELLLAAAAGCSAIDVDYLTSRRAEPEQFEVRACAPKLRDEQGNHLGEVELSFTITFPAGPDGDRARDVLHQAVRKSRDRLCTVSRTIQLGAPVTYRVGGEPV